MKNTVYILAKQHPITPPELFGSIVAAHFTGTYKHIHGAHVKVITHRWTRMTVDGKPHPHSFFRDGAETRNVEITATEGEGINIRSAIAGLLVLKSTGSAFHGFVQDEYTTLTEANDRILSTEADAGWTWKTFSGVEAVTSAAQKFNEAWSAAREITLTTFATDDSASVQNTMYKMCEQILTAVPGVEAVDYSLPNKHYFEIGKSFVYMLASHINHYLQIARLELAQGSQKHRQGCRGIRSTNKPERSHSMYCYPWTEACVGRAETSYTCLSIRLKSGRGEILYYRFHH